MKRLLIPGYGDIATRAVFHLGGRVEVRGLSRKLGFDLDRPETLSGIAGWADTVLHCAPPPPPAPGQADADPRTANLLAALSRAASLPTRIVYLSTSGVYGDCGGAVVDESRPPSPQTPRARRRVAAERLLGEWCTAHRVDLVILRVPGIYAADRLPLDRLRKGIPVLRDEDDVYTSHVHADDLAAAACRALEPDAPPGIYNAADDTRLKMAQWLDLVADHAGLPRPARIARSEAGKHIPATLLAFMGESRRLANGRLKAVLPFAFAYPTVREGLAAAFGATSRPRTQTA